MNLKYLASLVTGVLECILFSGILFGWPALRYVLEKNGYFSNHCEDVQEPDASTLVMLVTATYTGNDLNRNMTDDVRLRTDLQHFNSTAMETTVAYSTQTDRTVYEYPTCSTQAEMLNLAFTIASTLLSFSTLVNGYIYDTFGTWVARVISVLLFTLGCILMAISSLHTSWLLFPALTSFAIGGILMLVTNLQIGNLFGKFRSSVITMMSGSLDSSSFVFLIFKMLYDAGASLSGIFHVLAWCTILLWIRTFFLLPRNRIPFPVAKGYDYGIGDCKSQNGNPQQKELALMQTSESIHEEKTALANETNVETKNSSPPVSVYLRESLFWGNVAHFSMLQLRNYFFMGTLFEWIKPLTSSDDELSSYLNVFGICQLFGVCFAPFNGLLIDTATRVLEKKTKNDELVPLRAVTYSAIATTLLGTLFSIIVAIPSLPLQYLSFILQVVFRSFLYGGNMSFIAVAFPGEHFGKLYGITMFVGGCVSLLQFPLLTLVLRQMEGDFRVINIIMVFVSLGTIAHPYNIHRWCRNKAAAKTKPFIEDEENVEA